MGIHIERSKYDTSSIYTPFKNVSPHGVVIVVHRRYVPTSWCLARPAAPHNFLAPYLQEKKNLLHSGLPVPSVPPPPRLLTRRHAPWSCHYRHHHPLSLARHHTRSAPAKGGKGRELDCAGVPAFFFIIFSMASSGIILPKVQVQVEADHDTSTVVMF
jgi:hypothetical protein